MLVANDQFGVSSNACVWFVAVSLALTPRVPLDPGEYVVYLAGIRNFAFIGNLKTGSDRWAFAVVNR